MIANDQSIFETGQATTKKHKKKKKNRVLRIAPGRSQFRRNLHEKK